MLEVGCGSGGNLRRMIDYGAPPENLFGFDLLPDRLRQARRQCPEIGVAQARRAWLTKEQVLNTRPWAEIERLLAR